MKFMVLLQYRGPEYSVGGYGEHRHNGLTHAGYGREQGDGAEIGTLTSLHRNQGGDVGRDTCLCDGCQDEMWSCTEAPRLPFIERRLCPSARRARHGNVFAAQHRAHSCARHQGHHGP